MPAKLWPECEATMTIHGPGWRGFIVSVSKAAVTFRCEGEKVLAEVSRFTFLQDCRLLVPSSHSLWTLPKDAVDTILSYCSIDRLFTLHKTCRLGASGVASFFSANSIVHKPLKSQHVHPFCSVHDMTRSHALVCNLESQRESYMYAFCSGFQVIKKSPTKITAIAASGFFVAVADIDPIAGDQGRVKLYNITNTTTSKTCIFSCKRNSLVTALLFCSHHLVLGNLVMGEESGHISYLQIDVPYPGRLNVPSSLQMPTVICRPLRRRLHVFRTQPPSSHAPGVCALANMCELTNCSTWNDHPYHFAAAAWEDGTVLLVHVGVAHNQTCASFRKPVKRAVDRYQGGCCLAVEDDEDRTIVAASLGRFVDLWYLDKRQGELRGPLGTEADYVTVWNTWTRGPIVSVGPSYRSPVTAMAVYNGLLWTASTSTGRIDGWEHGVRKFSFFSTHGTTVSGLVFAKYGRIVTSADGAQPLLHHRMPCCV